MGITQTLATRRWQASDDTHDWTTPVPRGLDAEQITEAAHQ